MRTRFLVAAALFGSALAVAEPPPLAAQPDEELADPPADPPDAPEAPSPEAPPPEAPKPPSNAPLVPPITINITNNNTGNNSNTNTNDNKQDNQQTNHQDNQQTNHQDSKQDNQQTVTAGTGVSVPPPMPLAPLPTIVERYELSRREPVRWISVAATGNLDGKPGVRASIDLFGRRGFTVGIAGSVDGDVEGGGHRDSGGGAAVGYLAYTAKLWKLDVRAQVGLGAGIGGAKDRDGGARDESRKVTPASSDATGQGAHEADPELTPRAEAALLVGLPLGKHLGVIAGPVVSTSRLEAEHGAVDVTMTGGLRWRF